MYIICVHYRWNRINRWHNAILLIIQFKVFFFFFSSKDVLIYPSLCKSWIKYILRFHSNWFNNYILWMHELEPFFKFKWDVFYLRYLDTIHRRETLMVADVEFNEIMCYHRLSIGLTLIRGLLLYTDTFPEAWSRVKALNYVARPIHRASDAHKISKTGDCVSTLTERRVTCRDPSLTTHNCIFISPVYQ